MKTRFTTLMTLTAGIAMSLPAIAQTVDTSRYNPIFEKRADLRVQYQQARNESSPTLRLHRSADDDNAVAAEGPGHGRLLEFVTLAAKRGDLRARSSQVGIDAAYAEWLKK